MRWNAVRLLFPALLAGLAACSSGPPPPPTAQEQTAYRETAAAQSGAQTTASGLIYRDLSPGSGPLPTAANTVRVHYKGTLTNGTEFDSSYGGDPVEFPLTRVIPCWTEGVQKIHVGGKAQLVCPSDIAYGNQSPPGIPAGSTLVFEVELLAIVN